MGKIWQNDPTLKASRTLECGLEAALMAGQHKMIFKYQNLVWQRYRNIKGMVRYLI